MQRDTMGFAGLGFLWLLLSGLILFHFHDQFWWGPDEGVYAYVAQRFLAGDTIHRDLIDIHPGYGNLHASPTLFQAMTSAPALRASAVFTWYMHCPNT